MISAAEHYRIGLHLPLGKLRLRVKSHETHESIPFNISGDLDVLRLIWSKKQAVEQGKPPEEMDEVDLILPGGAMLFPVISAAIHTLDKLGLLYATDPKQNKVPVFNNIYTASAAAVVSLYTFEENKKGITERFIHELTANKLIGFNLERLLGLNILDQSVLTDLILRIYREGNIPNLEKFANSGIKVFATTTDFITGKTIFHQLNLPGATIDYIRSILMGTTCMPLITGSRRKILWAHHPDHPNGEFVVDGNATGQLLIKQIKEERPGVPALIFNPFPITDNPVIPPAEKIKDKSILVATKVIGPISPCPEGLRQSMGERHKNMRRDMKLILQPNSKLAILKPDYMPIGTFCTDEAALITAHQQSLIGIEQALLAHRYKN